MIPEWAKKHQKPCTTIKEIGNNYYLYYATSAKVVGKKYPVSRQTYIGRITPEGVISERVSIKVKDTEAKTLGELIPDVPAKYEELILLKVKGGWYFTKTNNRTVEELQNKGIYGDDGQLIF